MDNSGNLCGLALSQIAAWSLPDDPSLGTCDVNASLPALQRGSVWRPKQVELLWDSLMSGLPIGALLLSEFDRELGSRQLTVSGTPKSDRLPTHHLIDGQQRALAIALGFLDVWGCGDIGNCRYALWVDLAKPKLDDRAFLFRMITSAHPWGYKKADPAERLSAVQCREALATYRAVYPRELLQHIEFRAGKIPLKYCWPHDAEAPVPVRFLLDAVRESDPAEALQEKLNALSIWRDARVRGRIEKRLESDDTFFNRSPCGVRRMKSLARILTSMSVMSFTLFSASS